MARRQQLKTLQRENVELKRANEIPRQAPPSCAQMELDLRGK